MPSIHSWEPWLEPYVPTSGDIALDIGGNLGQWSQSLSKRFNEVYCVEPVFESANAIKALKLPNVTVLTLAAWLHQCELPFAVRKGNTEQTDIECHSGHSAVICRDFHRDQFPISEVRYVEAGAMDDMLEFVRNRIDFIKIDTEGSELPALQGCTKIIEANHPALIIECHAEENVEWIRIWLTRCGYNIHILHGPGYTPEHPNWASHLWIAAQWQKPMIREPFL